MVRRMLISAMIAIVFVSVLVTPAKAQSAQDDQNTLKQALYNLDMSIDSLRKGDSSGATSSLNGARTEYNKLVENKNYPDDTRIKASFSSLIQTSVEDNIRALRADVVLAASALGVSLSPILTQSILFILLVSILFALVATLITKRVVNWEEVKRKKKIFGDWQRELMSAQRKKDMKTVHKLQQQQKEMMSLQGQIMSASFKPAIFTMILYFILWWALSGVYSNWVVAWLPFNLPMPIIGTMASLSFLSWFILAYFGFSSIWRRLLIGD